VKAHHPQRRENMLDHDNWWSGFDPKTDSPEWTAGRRAQRDGFYHDANPHPPLTTEHELWGAGWWDGEHDDDRRRAARG
jgi:hypothetical protein